MKLAVVIPCYNHARYIGAAIESVLNQSRPPERILVIDDGSRDDSVDVIRGYAKDGVEWQAQENKGAHHTINHLIEKAAEDCDLVSILNSDDLYEPARFEILVPALAEEQAVICSALRMIDDDNQPLPEDAPRAKWLRAVYSMAGVEDLDLAEWLGLANFPLSTSNVIGRASYLKANPFRPYRFNHDYFFLASTVLRGQLAYVNEPLLLYRAHDTNTIQTEPAPLLREMLRMHLDLYHHFAAELKEDEAMRRRFAAFTRASWDSISAFPAGLYQVLLAQLAAEVPQEELAALVAEWESVELHRFPNSGLISAHDGKSPLLDAANAGEKISEMRRTTKAVKGEVTALKQLNRLRTELARSRWFALGRLMGQGKDLVGNEGKTPAEKLTCLEQAMDQSAWIRWGRKMGWLTVPKAK